jgi:L-2-hydroxyglutarate oxidase LhgO
MMQLMYWVALCHKQALELERMHAPPICNSVRFVFWQDSTVLCQVQLLTLLMMEGTDMQAGAEVRLSTEISAAEASTSGFDFTTCNTNSGSKHAAKLRASCLVNSAGLTAHEVAGRISGLDKKHIPEVHYAKGNYFLTPGEHVFKRLVYPVPEDGGLGAHLTIDLNDDIKFGPDVEWLDTKDPGAIDYRVDPGRAEKFLKSIEQFWPGIKDREFLPGYSGVRPKLSGPGEKAADFLIQGPAEHGLPGYVGLYGIESPGLTSCMALADAVWEKLQGREQLQLRSKL